MLGGLALIIQLQPNQISEYWHQIKPGAISALELDPLDPKTSEYSNSLFIALLNGANQAWLIFNDARDVYAMGITSILEDLLVGVRMLHVDAFYSYQTLSDELAQEATHSVLAYAKANNCTKLHALTSNPRAARLLELVGFHANKTEYVMSCG